MVKTESIEGTGSGTLWYHYDVTNDVLYLRLSAYRDHSTHAEETDDGLLILRADEDESVVGITIIDWWKRFGAGALPDSLRALESAIEPWTRRLAA